MFTRVFRPTIRDARELRGFVVRVIVGCVALSLCVDVIMQLVFFVDWPSAYRSWVVTILETAVLAAPISFGVGATNLELYRAQQVAELASRTDPMTGLMNRRALSERLQRLDGGTLALVIADIDNFKRVNDLYGHLAGDRVIEAVARMMADELAGLGPLARVGGEEFALISQDIGAEEIAARLDATRRRIAETPIVADGRAVRVTISAGIAGGGQRGEFDALYARADRALYLAKLSGRNRVLTFEEIADFEPPHAGAASRPGSRPEQASA
jgi:diguanylate cyclase (GGDEF)-like protein